MRRILVTGLGTGYLPIAPGTWASAAVAGIFLAAGWLYPPALAPVLVGIIVLASAICVWAGPYAEAHFGRKDPSQVTIDEWAGQAVALLALPMGTGWAGHCVAAGVAFVLFRVLDIVKPPPAAQAQALRAGWGILIDDLVAGVYANLVAQAVLRWVLHMS
jgi:phosphatidylglycerophosphatase A